MRAPCSPRESFLGVAVALVLAALLIADLLPFRWTRLHAEFAPDGGLDRVIVSATNLAAQRRAVEALRD